MKEGLKDRLFSAMIRCGITVVFLLKISAATLSGTPDKILVEGGIETISPTVVPDVIKGDDSGCETIMDPTQSSVARPCTKFHTVSTGASDVKEDICCKDECDCCCEAETEEMVDNLFPGTTDTEVELRLKVDQLLTLNHFLKNTLHKELQLRGSGSPRGRRGIKSQLKAALASPPNKKQPKMSGTSKLAQHDNTVRGALEKIRHAANQAVKRIKDSTKRAERREIDQIKGDEAKAEEEILAKEVGHDSTMSISMADKKLKKAMKALENIESRGVETQEETEEEETGQVAGKLFDSNEARRSDEIGNALLEQ